MPNKSYLISDVISNLYRYGASSLQIVNKDITDKDWFIHFKVNEEGNIDIYRESIIYTDDTKEEIEDKYFWNVDDSELSYYISYLLSASLTGGLKEVSDNSLEDSKELNEVVEKMYLLTMPKLAISNREITEIFNNNDLTMLDIFNSKEGNINLINYDFPEDLINDINISLSYLENKIDYIREVYVKLTSGKLDQFYLLTEEWLKLRGDSRTPNISDARTR